MNSFMAQAKVFYKILVTLCLFARSTSDHVFRYEDKEPSVVYFLPSLPFTIPCHVASPQTLVKLRPKEIHDKLEKFMTFNYSQGFVVSSAPSDLWGHVWCQTQEDNQTYSQEFYFYNLARRPPELSVAKYSVILSPGQEFTVNCSGEQPVIWEYPLQSLSNVSELSVPFESQLQVRNVHPNQTGWYNCVYNGTSSHTFRDRTATSLYIFFTDPLELFVARSSDLTELEHDLSLNHPLVIDCRVTHPNISVTLWQVREACSAGQRCQHTRKDDSAKQLLPDGEQLSYDVTRGFVFKYLDPNYQSVFICKADYKSKRDTRKFRINIVQSGTWKPPVPMVNQTISATPNVISLHCQVVFLKGNLSQPKLTWTHLSHQIVEEHQNMTQKEVEGEFVVLTSHLEVRTAPKGGGAIFTCSLLDELQPGTSYSTSVFIPIEEVTPAIQFRLVSNTLAQEERLVEERFSIQVSFEGVNGSDLSLTWERDGFYLTSEGSVSISRSPLSSTLTLKDICPKDSGLYVLTARLTGTNLLQVSSTQLLIRYLEPVEVENDASLYQVGGSYILTCTIQGYPNTSLVWSFKPCLALSDCDFYNDDGWTDITEEEAWSANKERVHPLESLKADQTRLQITLTAHRTGFYRCTGSNQLGGSQSFLRFPVIDVPKGFTFNGTSSEPFEGDPVTLTCFADNFLFGKPEITWTNPQTLKELEEDSIPGTSVSVSHTDYSVIVTLTIPSVSLNNSGTYSCVAWYRQGADTDLDSRNLTLEQTITVQSLVPPKLSNQQSVQSVQYLEFRANVTIDCTVQGAPTPSVTWTKDGRPLSKKNNTFLADQDQKLIIYGVTVQDLGSYVCNASNRAGGTMHTFWLQHADKEPDKAEDIAVHPPPAKKPDIFMIVSVVCASLLVLVGTYFIIKRIYYRRKQRHEQELTSQRLFYKGQLDRLSSRLPLVDQADLLPYDPKWEFPKERLQMGRLLGQGAFGRVVQGMAVGITKGETVTPVAVKVLKENADPMQRQLLVAELKILIFLGKHLNIVNLLGAITKELNAGGDLMMIVEYCPHGNLQEFLQRHRQHFVDQRDPETGHLDYQRVTLPVTQTPIAEEAEPNYPQAFPVDYRATLADPVSLSQSAFMYYNKTSQDIEIEKPPPDPTRFVTTCDLLSYAFQCARGMDYLASRKLIHRDLAARNVLMADNNVVKICDFGLAKDSYSPCLAKQASVPMPVKWMALESIREGKFSAKTDVWSFGVLAWEMFTLGDDPYSGTALNEEFYTRLRNGYRLPKPEFSPNNLYEIMQNCWKENAEERPTFVQLVEHLGSMLESGVKEHYLMLNIPYSEMNAKDTHYLTTTGYINRIFAENDNETNTLQVPQH